MREIANKIIECLKSGHFLYGIGNGGSATMASHFCGELIGKFRYDRRALPAISLFDLASMTATANDFGYEEVFVRPLSALGRPGDTLLALSTSGKSKNVLKAIEWANKHKMIVIDLERIGTATAEIQENHLYMLHKIAGIIEDAFI